MGVTKGDTRSLDYAHLGFHSSLGQVAQDLAIIDPSAPGQQSRAWGGGI